MVFLLIIAVTVWCEVCGVFLMKLSCVVYFWWSCPVWCIFDEVVLCGVFLMKLSCIWSASSISSFWLNFMYLPFHLINKLHLYHAISNSEQWRIRIASHRPFGHIAYLLSIRTGSTGNVHAFHYSNKKIKKQSF